VPAAAAELRQQDGHPLVMYGHRPLGQTLLEHHLPDELRFMIHPVFAGRGTLLFREAEKTALTLVGTTTLETGVVVLSHQPAGN
jgi:dihydrofolate reductase